MVVLGDGVDDVLGGGWSSNGVQVTGDFLWRRALSLGVEGQVSGKESSKLIMSLHIRLHGNHGLEFTGQPGVPSAGE